MTDCPRCEKPFRGFKCECGYEPPKAKDVIPLPRFNYRMDRQEEINHRRERLEAIKRQFNLGRTA